MHMVVYRGGMGRTNIDIDDELIERAMRTFGLRTKREAVHLALERLVGGGPMSVEEQLDTEGIGWDGDLDAMRADRFVPWDDHAAG
jgi:Arc/MetJ family transcription regulator